MSRAKFEAMTTEEILAEFADSFYCAWTPGGPHDSTTLSVRDLDDIRLTLAQRGLKLPQIPRASVPSDLESTQFDLNSPDLETIPLSRLGIRYYKYRGLGKSVAAMQENLQYGLTIWWLRRIMVVFEKDFVAVSSEDAAEFAEYWKLPLPKFRVKMPGCIFWIYVDTQSQNVKECIRRMEDESNATAR